MLRRVNRTRELNTVVIDAASIAAVPGNQITLPAGTYRFTHLNSDLVDPDEYNKAPGPR